MYNDTTPEPGDRAGKENRDEIGLVTYTAEQLMNFRFKKQDFIVNNLIRPGLAILAGAPKVGKSWMVLDLCMRVAKGEDFLGNKVKRGDVLYLALEDEPRRLQKRMMTITDEGTPGLHITSHASLLGEGFIDELKLSLKTNPLISMIVIDTFQMIRGGKEMSYSNDYTDLSVLKSLADSENLCILLVHHTRKMPDSDYMNEISGTNGLAGCADTLMVLKREKRTSRSAVLSCTGRDIEDRELKLLLDKETCLWNVKSDSLSEPDESLPHEITELIEYMKDIGEFKGGNAEFAESFCKARKLSTNASRLKRLMNLYRDELEENGVEFVSGRENNKRMLGVLYMRTVDSRAEGEDECPSADETEDTPEPAADDAAVEEHEEQNEPSIHEADNENDAPPVCEDEDYLYSLLNDPAYFPEIKPEDSLLTEDDFYEEQALWDNL